MLGALLFYEKKRNNQILYICTYTYNLYIVHTCIIMVRFDHLKHMEGFTSVVLG
jgi:membrane-bound acyltransferase YfiQ involved in biofilm formation